jgi:hypothetical protein
MQAAGDPQLLAGMFKTIVGRPAFFETQGLARAIRYSPARRAARCCTKFCVPTCSMIRAQLQRTHGWQSVPVSSAPLSRIHPGGSTSDDWTGHIHALKPIKKATIMEQARRLFCQQLALYSHNPSDPDCLHCMYARWMLQAGDHSTLPVPAYISAQMHRNTKLAMAQLRLGTPRCGQTWNATIQHTNLHPL